jgi:hypothetical protein
LIEKIGAAMNISNDIQSYVARNFRVVLHSHSYTKCLGYGTFIRRMLSFTNVAPIAYAKSFELG